MRIRLLSLAFILVFAPGMAHALGLGKLQLQSALNEPLEARIELVSATAEELASLHVDLADDDAFRHAGIPRPYVLNQLRFTVKESETGPDYIRVSSNDPIREPFLNFLVEINWSKGRLYREYTVLLDPPLYVTEQARKAITPPPVTTMKQEIPKPQETGVRKEEGNGVVYYPEYKPSTREEMPPAGTMAYGGGDYGPVESGETLWSIARAMRPDESVSIQQMMFALLRSNPEAFIDGNINGLKRGYVLKAPDLSGIQSLTKNDAYEQAQLQNSQWEEARQALAAAPPVRPAGPSSQPAEAVAEAAPPVKETKKIEGQTAPAMVEGKPELRLVAPGAEGKSAGQGGIAEPGQEALAKELALATESLEALKQENIELKDKISETDAILADLNRLITLKEDELAALQQQVAQQAVKKEEVAAAPATAPAKTGTLPKQGEQPAAQQKQVAQAPATETTAAPQKPATPVKPSAQPQQKKPGAEATLIASILASVSGLLDLARNNLLYIAGGLGVILLGFLAAYFIDRRRTATAVEIPESAFTAFRAEPALAIDSEDRTDSNLEESESEAITILPGEETETTQAAATPAATGAVAGGAVLEEADPLEEVNVFLAYEHFDQAEEFVKNALEKEPDNLAYHCKLLEVYYTANNKKAYEEAARVLHDKVKGKGDYWNMALAMWQVLSPNRALFAAPAAGEEPAEAGTGKEGGGIVNITGEGETGAAATAMDLDLDTTGGGAEGDTLEVEAEAKAEPDVLDVTAAIATADNEVLDVTAAVDVEDTGVAEEPGATVAEEDKGLDFSLDLDAEEKAPEAEKPRDESSDLLQSQEETTASPGKDVADEALEFSLDLEEPEQETATRDLELEISLDAPEPALESEPEASAFLEMEELEKPGTTEQAGGLDLDISLDSGAEPELDISHTGSALLDATSTIESAVEEAEVSPSGSELLDVTSSLSLEESKPGPIPEKADVEAEELLNVSTPVAEQGTDMLDVTAATDFDLESGQDLLDITAAASSADIERDDERAVDLDTGGGGAEALDFELAPDQAAAEDQAASTFDGIDITSGSGMPEEEARPAPEPSPVSEEEKFEMDMDSTMQIPASRSVLAGKGAEEDAMVRVPRSSGDAQSDEDEIATQLDLAKAYIELGNVDSAKTILSEIIAVGSDAQREQAQELLGQIA